MSYEGEATCHFCCFLEKKVPDLLGISNKNQAKIFTESSQKRSAESSMASIIINQFHPDLIYRVLNLYKKPAGPLLQHHSVDLHLREMNQVKNDE